MVLAIAQQTFRGDAHCRPLQAYTARVMALAKAHEVATTSSWTSARIGDVVEGALASHRGGDGRFKIGGPVLKVSPSKRWR